MSRRISIPLLSLSGNTSGAGSSEQTFSVSLNQAKRVTFLDFFVELPALFPSTTAAVGNSWIGEAVKGARFSGVYNVMAIPPITSTSTLYRFTYNNNNRHFDNGVVFRFTVTGADSPVSPATDSLRLWTADWYPIWSLASVFSDITNLGKLEFTMSWS